MKMTYDPYAQASYITLAKKKRVHRTHVVSSNVIIDLDKDGEPVGIELLGVSAPKVKYLGPPTAMAVDVPDEALDEALDVPPEDSAPEMVQVAIDLPQPIYNALKAHADYCGVPVEIMLRIMVMEYIGRL